MAAWPVAFEEGMKEAMRRHLPEGTFSIYGEGHSTGGPFVSMLSQRVPNFAGVVATEHTPFGHVGAMRDNWSGSLGKVSGFERVSTDDAVRSDPFNELYIRTWRDLARYAGPEALGQQGPAALMQLPLADGGYPRHLGPGQGAALSSRRSTSSPTTSPGR